MQALLQTAVAEQDKHMFLSYITSSRRLVWHFHGVIGEPGTYLPAPQFSAGGFHPYLCLLVQNNCYSHNHLCSRLGSENREGKRSVCLLSLKKTFWESNATLLLAFHVIDQDLVL